MAKNEKIWVAVMMRCKKQHKQQNSTTFEEKLTNQKKMLILLKWASFLICAWRCMSLMAAGTQLK
ncbi:hypothetical protein [Clostridium sp. 1001283B150225_161107_B6]|jgi:hypothetical protein|uniref:hypothetical protein n=1 Tax=Clostridium sp. 1001283B150225_161107_B6 TaxID=2787141 RepID=UPI001A9B3931|nr:hypothetical protein [Clostridium sp. 1001283B150225_161107_B6]